MTLFIILHFVICCFLVAVILIQPGKGDAGIGFGSSSQSIFGSKGAGNFLTKTTSVCAVVFLLTSFWLTRSRIQDATRSVISDDERAETGAPATPSQPAAATGKQPDAQGTPAAPGKK